MTKTRDQTNGVHLQQSDEDQRMAEKRAMQLAALVPVLADATHPALAELAIELADDLSCALANLR